MIGVKNFKDGRDVKRRSCKNDIINVSVIKRGGDKERGNGSIFKILHYNVN